MNSSDRIAVQRYAAAYNDLSHTSEEAFQRAADLRTACEALSTAAEYMTSPRVPSEQKKKMVKEALKGAPLTAQFVEVLIEAKRYALLAPISTQVRALLDERLGITRAEVVSARELSAVQKEDTLQALSSRYGGKVEASFSIDPTLLGGLKILCRGELIDGTLQRRLAKLQEELIH